MKNRVLFTYLVISLFFGQGLVFANWQWQNLSLGGDVRSVLYKEGDLEADVLFSTSQGLYRLTLDPSRIVGKILSGVAVNKAFIDKNGMLYVAADQGLYIEDKGVWQRELKSKQVHDVLSVEGSVWAATQDGLYQRTPEGWSSSKGEIGRIPIRKLLLDGQFLWVMGDSALYKIDLRGMSQSRELALSAIDTEASIDTGDEETQELFGFQDMVAGQEGIYVAASDQVFVLRHGQKAWEDLELTSLPAGIVSIAVLDRDGHDVLCLATSQGVFYTQGQGIHSWREGMDDLDLRTLVRYKDNSLIAVTRRGIYWGWLAQAEKVIERTGCELSRDINIQEVFAKEPSVQDVQEMARAYADVEKSKIDRWQRQSRVKALIPKVSVGVDRDATDLYHWDTGQNPDVLMSGESTTDWDLSFSWDLADIVWSGDQTSIDSRSKMMVELREDILDQVTRIYFERRRLQLDLIACDYQNYGERVSVDLRVEELTALLDAYTGGSFSDRLNQHGVNIKQLRRVQR